MLDIKLKDIGLRKRTFALLEANNFHNLKELVEAAAFNFDSLKKSNLSEFIKMFTKNIKLKGFGKASIQDLENAIEKHLIRFEESGTTDFFELYVKESLDKIEEEEAEETDEETYDEDETYDYPVKSLFINTLPIKGIASISLLEDVLVELEELILDNHEVEYLEEIPGGEGLKQLAALVEMNEWLGDSPIYISQEAAKVYVDVIVTLTKKATIVLKGI